MKHLRLAAELLAGKSASGNSAAYFRVYDFVRAIFIQRHMSFSLDVRNIWNFLILRPFF